jgi:hypothetical protein
VVATCRQWRHRRRAGISRTHDEIGELGLPAAGCTQRYGYRADWGPEQTLLLEKFPSIVKL